MTEPPSSPTITIPKLIKDYVTFCNKNYENIVLFYTTSELLWQDYLVSVKREFKGYENELPSNWKKKEKVKKLLFAEWKKQIGELDVDEEK